MKFLLISLVVVLGFVVFGLLFLAYQSKSLTPTLGVLDGELTACSKPSNCVNSMASSEIAPIDFQSSSESAWQQMQEALMRHGGTIEQKNEVYLWATFRTPLLGFVDDVEILMVAESQHFHIRSASRVGRSDFSANRNRVELIRLSFSENTHQ